MILVYLGRWSYGWFKDDNNIFHKMKNDLTTGTWQVNIWCSINIILLCTSDDTRTKFQRFTSDAPCSSFKKLVVSTPKLLPNLHLMSLAKAMPNSLKDRKCKKIALRKCPPIPYVPKKHCVHKMDLSFKDNHLKTQIGKGTEFWVPIWHSRMHEAFCIHVGFPRKQ